MKKPFKLIDIETGVVEYTGETPTTFGGQDMSKSIIEKLGITPGPWKGLHGGGVDKRGIKKVYSMNGKSICSVTKNKKDTANTELISTAPEMLEALIDVCLDLEESCSGRAEIEDKYDPIIQKATGKSWEEIKELL